MYEATNAATASGEKAFGTLQDAKNLLRLANRLTAGQKITMRRHLGIPFERASREAKCIFYLFLGPYLDMFPVENVQERLFFILCLYCSSSEVSGKTMAMQDYLAGLYREASLGQKKGEEAKLNSAQKKITTILAMREDSNGALYRNLSYYILQAKRDNIAISAGELLNDLWWWDSSTGSVINKWAKAIARTNSKDTDNSNSKKENEVA